jgi:asparagine synthetase B (glutamine-hydrolysing)
MALAPGERSYIRCIRNLPQAPLLLMEMDQGAAWAGHFGFTLLYPYWDRDLMQLMLRVHPEHLIAGGRAKGPLRRMVAERLPSLALRSKKVDFTQMVHRALRPNGRAVWQKLGGPEMLADLGIVDPDRCRARMQDYFEGRSDNWVGTWLLVSTEVWLRARSSAPIEERRFIHVAKRGEVAGTVR